MAECPQETCFWSDGAGCGLGYLDPSALSGPEGSTNGEAG